jgi:hypothetical protein
MQANRWGSEHQQQSVDALIVRSVAPALRLHPSKAIWGPSTTFSGRLYSTGTLLLRDRQKSTVLSNHLLPACTSARWRSVAGSRAPGLIYAAIFLCNIPRISSAFRLRAPNPYQNASVVVCRLRWRNSMEATTAQSCVSGDGRENGIMWLPYVPWRPLDIRLRHTGKTWKGWRFSSTWGGSLCMMMLTPRPCSRI